MKFENEAEEFAKLVEKHFDDSYLKANSPNESFLDLIREKKIWPVKWVLSEIKKEELTESEVEFLDYLRQVYI